MDKEFMKREMSDKENVFWGKYAEYLIKYRVEGHNAEWHVRRAQEFVYGLDGLKLYDIDSAYFDSYLDVIGRKPELKAWQLKPSSLRNASTIPREKH